MPARRLQQRRKRPRLEGGGLNDVKDVKKLVRGCRIDSECDRKTAVPYSTLSVAVGLGRVFSPSAHTTV